MKRYFLVIPVLLALVLVNFKQSVPCANSISCINNLNTEVENEAVGIFNGQEIVPPKVDLAAVLGDISSSAETGEKHIYVNLANQTLYAYQGNDLYMQVLISSGKWGRTPTGDFTIWTKLRSTRMTGGRGSDYYNLPNVPFVMFFSNADVPATAGYSFHGTYWHNNFGYPMSHGCINMRITDAEKLYNWAENAAVTIYDN